MFIIKRNDTRNFPAQTTYLVRITTPGINTDTEFYDKPDKAIKFVSVEQANDAIEKLHQLAKKNGWRVQTSPMYEVVEMQS